MTSSSSSCSSMSSEERGRWRERKRTRKNCVLVEMTEQHPDTVLKGLNRLRLNRELCDVVLCCGGQEFPCHRAVLASFSSYFQAMFTCGMLESRQDRVNVHGVEAHILDLLLTYAYTSEVAIPKEHVQDVLAAAHMLDVEAVQERCCSYMRDHLDNNNCLGINSFAEAHSLEDLERSCMHYITQHFGDVYMQEEFLSLPVDKVTKILSGKNLNVPKEEVVFEAAMLWINKCPTRRQHFEKFLELIRLPLISPSYLHDAMESLEVVKESPCCQRLISESMEQHRLPYSKTVHPRSTKEVMVMVGGWSNGEMLDRVEYLDPDFLDLFMDSNDYKNLARLPFKVHRHGLAVIGTTLYVAGGELPDVNFLTFSKELWRYDPLHDDSWTKMASMIEARFDFSLVVLDGYLWAVGGQESSGSFVERYDPRTNTWQLNQDMPRCSNHPVVVALDGLIYVFAAGSPDTDTPAYKYNPKTAEWTEVAPRQDPRIDSAACTLNGKIYVIGGEDLSTPPECFESTTNKVECYDPMTKQWSMCASMQRSCRNPGVVAMAGKIYVLGGINDCAGELRDIQEYCDQTDTWERVGELRDYRTERYSYRRCRYVKRGPAPTGRSYFNCVSLWLSTDVKEVPYPKAKPQHESDDF